MPIDTNPPPPSTLITPCASVRKHAPIELVSTDTKSDQGLTSRTTTLEAVATTKYLPEASSLFDLRDSLSRLEFVARDVKIIGGGRGPVLGRDALVDLLKLVEDAVTRKVEPTERSGGEVFFERGDASFSARAYELQM